MTPLPCPIWNPDPALKVNLGGHLDNWPRAGGRFRLMQDAIPLLRQLSDKQKSNLSYWICDHNRRLQDDTPESSSELDLAQAWMEAHQDCKPNIEDRAMSFLRELIRMYDQGSTQFSKSIDLLCAAGGCSHDKEFDEFLEYAEKKEWIKVKHRIGSRNIESVRVSAREALEEWERTKSQSR